LLPSDNVFMVIYSWKCVFGTMKHIVFM